MRYNVSRSFHTIPTFGDYKLFDIDALTQNLVASYATLRTVCVQTIVCGTAHCVGWGIWLGNLVNSALCAIMSIKRIQWVGFVVASVDRTWWGFHR